MVQCGLVRRCFYVHGDVTMLLKPIPRTASMLLSCPSSYRYDFSWHYAEEYSVQPQLMLRLVVLEALSALAGCTCTVGRYLHYLHRLLLFATPWHPSLHLTIKDIITGYLSLCLLILCCFAEKPRNCLSRILTLGDLIQDLHSLIRSKPPAAEVP